MPSASPLTTVRPALPSAVAKASASRSPCAVALRCPVALGIEQYRRVVRRQQALRVVGIGQGQQVVAGLPRPIECELDLGRAFVSQQAFGQGLFDDSRKLARPGVKDGLWQAEGFEQGAPGFAADARNQREAQPGSEFVAVRHDSVGTCQKIVASTAQSPIRRAQ